MTWNRAAPLLKVLNRGKHEQDEGEGNSLYGDVVVLNMLTGHKEEKKKGRRAGENTEH